MNVIVVLLLSPFSLLLTTSTSYGQDCAPSIIVSSNHLAIDKLVVSKPDTVDIQVGCLTDCPVLAESKHIEITSIGKGRFVFVPKIAGRHEVKVYTSCPKGTSITMSGNKMNASGKLPIGSWRVEAVQAR